MASKCVEEGSKSHRKWVDFVSNVGRVLVKNKPRGGRNVVGKWSKSGRGGVGGRGRNAKVVYLFLTGAVELRPK